MTVVGSDEIPIKIENPPEVIPKLTSYFPSQQSKIVIPLGPKLAKAPIPSRPNALSTYKKKQEVNRLTRELWNTRRELSAAQARESTIMRQIEQLSGSPVKAAEPAEPPIDKGSSTFLHPAGMLDS